MAHYSLDDGSGTTATDDSGNGNHAVIHGASWSSDCISGSCLEFNGIDAFLKILDSTSLDFDKSSGTIEMWLKPLDKARGTIQSLVRAARSSRRCEL